MSYSGHLPHSEEKEALEDGYSPGFIRLFVHSFILIHSFNKDLRVPVAVRGAETTKLERQYKYVFPVLEDHRPVSSIDLTFVLRMSLSATCG